MGTSFLIALWASVWADNSLAGRVVVLAILILAFRAWKAAAGQVSRFRRERKHLEVVAERLIATLGSPEVSKGSEEGDSVRENSSEQGSTEETGEVTNEAKGKPPRGVVEVGVLSDAAHPQSLIYQRLEAIGRLRRHHVKVNLPTLQALSRAQVAADPGFEAAGRVASQAMMLGIFGTFLGLAAMVQEIQWALPETEAALTLESWTQGFRNVSAVMAGIKTAFSTSLVGMLAALVLTRIDHRVHDSAAGFFSRFERFTVEELLPATAPTLEDEDLLEGVAGQMERSFERLGEVFGQSEEMLESLNGVHESYLDILDSLRSIHRSEASEELGQVAEGLAATHRSVLQVVESLPRIASAIETSQERFLDRLSPTRQVATGLANLWTARLPGGIPGSLVMIVLTAGLIVWAFIRFS